MIRALWTTLFWLVAALAWLAVVVLLWGSAGCSTATPC